MHLFLRKPLKLKMFIQIIKFLLPLVQVLESRTVTLSAKHQCEESKCGNVTIQYPFSTRIECSMGIWFLINCNATNQRLFLPSINLEVTEIDYGNSRIQVNSPIISNNCSGHTSGRHVSLKGTPYTFSLNNNFIAVGCNSSVLLTETEPTIAGCKPTCNKEHLRKEEICIGNKCCLLYIPFYLQVFRPQFEVTSNNNEGQESCMYTFIAEGQWLQDNVKDPEELREWQFVPAIVDWKINASDLGSFQIDEKSTEIFPTFNYDGFDFPYPNNTYMICRSGFSGNPYISDGCKDVNECLDPHVQRHCHGLCKNTRGSYKCMGEILILGTTGSLVLLIFVIWAWWLTKFMKKRKEIKLRIKFFKQNGGLLLRSQVESSQANVEKIKIFSSKELEKATDHFNENRILGQGGQGIVYKGMLVDGRIVAVKKSEKVDEAKIQEFINEVVILSQINHRNVVKLLGCCLETEVPLLVYEFIPNGTLYHYLHDNNEEFKLSWKMRLQIATEVSEALSYLHSAASIPIYHRDVKSTNILLDEKYRAKVSDFGTSRPIQIDQTHLTTHVLGTFGYVDPEYFLSRKFTEKSDVYSFGVVLVELLTGTEPVSSTRVQEGIGLAAHFIHTMEDEKLFDIIDPHVKDQCDTEQLMMVANLAKSCLNSNGKQRPTMKQVTRQLEGINFSQKDSSIQQNNTGVVDCDSSEDSYASTISTSNNFP